MQQDRLRWAIIGPIIGFILLYFVLRFAVTQFSADRHALGEFGVATISEVQEMEAAANAEEATVEGETADGETTDGEAVAEGEVTADGEAAVDGEAATDGEAAVDGEAATDGEATADGEAVADGAEVGAVDETEGTEVVEELITNTWVLTSINKQNALGGWPVTALWSSDGTVIGSSGCNYYNTNAAVEGDSVSFTVPTSTRMMCPSEAVMLQESIFLGALGNVTTFSDTGLELILSDDTGDLEIRFTSLAAMEATSWLVESYMDSTGAEVDIAADSAITANFENNTLSGNDGCANYQSQYSVDGEIIFFLPPEYSPAGTDVIECATGDVREQQARDYEIALGQARLYEFGDDSLNLYDDQHDLVISYRAVTE